MKLNNKGFTLVELLASMVILAMLMMVAVPNVVGILANNRNKTYVEDAKKLATNVEYKVRGDNTIKKPSNRNCIIMALGKVNNSDFDTAPYGGSYGKTSSFVIVTNDNGTYKYYVQLVENMPEAQHSGHRGVALSLVDSLYGDDATNHVSNITNGKVCSTSSCNASDLKASAGNCQTVEATYPASTD